MASRWADSYGLKKLNGLIIRFNVKLSPITYLQTIIGIFFCVSLSGCNFLGSKVLPQDRQSYNYALKDTEEEQLLLNLVRMQYGDRPYFLGVASITAVTSFSRGVGANISGAATRQRFLVPTSNNPVQTLLGVAGLSPNMNYVETPTITYSPLQGSTFTKQMLTPVTLDKIALLIHSGWSVARTLRITTQAIGLLKNAPGTSRPGTSHIPEHKNFIQFSHMLRTIERNGYMSIHALPKKKLSPFTMEVTLIKTTPKARQSMQKLLKLLGFKYYHNKFFIIESDRGTVNDATETVTIQTRSFLGILYYLSKSVEVRQQDIDDKIVVVPRYKNGHYFNWREVTKGMMNVHFSMKKPVNNVTVAIRYRGMWFYIMDSDVNSKETLSLLQQLFSLQAGNLSGNTPSLTLPI